MATTPEGAVKKKIKAILTENGAYWVMPVSNGMGNHGVPDFLVCCNGRFIGIEAKAGTNKPTALQQHNIDRIFDAGGYALVINEDNLHVLQELLEWTTKK
jgi:Holliday junction resolvase